MIYLSFSKITKTISLISDGSFIRFKNREAAGESISHTLKKIFKKFSNNTFIVVCIPRGGVIVGDVIARNFRCTLDIVLPRRLISPLNKELSIGSIMKDGMVHLDNFDQFLLFVLFFHTLNIH